MRIRPWEEVLEEVTSHDANPRDWRAVAGQRESGVGEDLYLGHPSAGLYLLKTYAKNPYDLRGVGAQVARKVDEDLEPTLPERESAGRFAVQQPPDDPEEAATAVGEVLETHADAPTSPADCFEDVMDVLDSPAFGPMRYDPVDRPEALSTLSERLSGQNAEMREELERLLDRDSVRRGFE